VIEPRRCDAPAYLSDAGAWSTLSSVVVRVVTDTLFGVTDLDPQRLAAAKVAPADTSTAPLSADDLERLTAGIDPAWRVDGVRLAREFRFRTFAAAFALATRIALLAESANHHPTMKLSWGRLEVAWSTDAIGALSANDVIMAAKVDRLVSRGLDLKDGRAQPPADR
jgi:4a-hydroxytetrahydrobiopterin dehydratase